MSHTILFLSRPSEKAFRLSIASFRSLALVSFALHAMCGVMMTEGRVKSGEDDAGGSFLITSIPAPFILFSFSASYSAFSSTSAPRAVFMRTASLFIRESVLSFTMFSVSFVRGLEGDKQR